MAGKSPVARLAEAVIMLEERLEQLHGEVLGDANDLVRYGDMLARQVANDIDILVKQLTDELAREVENIYKGVRAEYEARIKAEVEKAEELGRKNMEAAVEAVVEEIKKLVAGG